MRDLDDSPFGDLIAQILTSVPSYESPSELAQRLQQEPGVSELVDEMYDLVDSVGEGAVAIRGVSIRTKGIFAAIWNRLHPPLVVDDRPRDAVVMPEDQRGNQ